MQWVALNLGAPSPSWSSVLAPSWCCFVPVPALAPSPGRPALLSPCTRWWLAGSEPSRWPHRSLVPSAPDPTAVPQPQSAWGFALCPGGLTAKTPFQPEGRPFSPLAGNDFIPTACSNSLLFCLKLSEHCLLLPFSLPPPALPFLLLKPAGQELFFLKGLIFHCR